MADKTPVRVVFNESNVATGMAEFQTGETVAVSHGGTGLSSIGSAGQILKVNAAGNALEFSPEGDVSITNLVAPTNADLTFTTSGTGNIVLDSITVRGATLSSSDSTSININENLIVDGTASVSGALTASTSLNIAGDGATVTGIKDEDDMSSNSDTKLATQQSIKAYVDSQLTASDLDFSTDDSTALSIDLDSETLHFAGGTGITTSSSTNTVTFAIDTGTVVDLTSSQTLTNKILTSPTIATPTITGNAIVNEIVSNGSNADLSIETSGTGNINLTAGADVVIPANIGLVFGDDAEKIEGDGTDLTITGNNIKLTATADVIIPTNVGLHFTDANEKIESDGSKLTITSGGTAFALPTADGSAGQALVTDGAGTLSFDSVSTTVSDDTLAIVRNNKNLNASARTIDSFNTTFNDSAWYMMVHNDLVNEVVSTQCFAVATNGSDGFLGANRGVESGGGSLVPTMTADVSNTMVRVRAAGSSADCKTSFYKIPLSSANTADATRGNTITTSNTDVDSASESIDTFAHATFRGAKYFISIDNDSKTEVDTIEALVVHDGSDAYITSYGGSSTGSNPLVTLSAALSGDNVVVSAAGLETNLNLTIHKILIKDNMTAESNANQKAFAAVTVSSTATAIDTFDLDDANGAVYYIVSKNASESSFAISEVFAAAAPGVAAVADGPQVSTKGTPLIEFSAGFDTATENSFELFASSTAGGSTTVTGYRISALAG